MCTFRTVLEVNDVPLGHPGAHENCSREENEKQRERG